MLPYSDLQKHTERWNDDGKDYADQVHCGGSFV